MQTPPLLFPNLGETNLNNTPYLNIPPTRQSPVSGKHYLTGTRFFETELMLLLRSEPLMTDKNIPY